MPYKGFIEVTFGNPKYIVVPMLVMKGRSLSQPNLGFNVIEWIIKTNTSEQLDATRTEQLQETLKAAFPSLKKENVTAFIDLVTADSCYYVVKTTKEKIIVLKHTSVQINCKVQTWPLKKDTVILFEPDINPQWAEGVEFCETLVKLRSCVSLHCSWYAKSHWSWYWVFWKNCGNLYPITILKKPSHPPPVSVSQVNAESEQVTDTPWNPPVDLSHLSESEREVQNMLREECPSFSKSDEDIGCIEKLKLSISLQDMDPVAHIYLSVPKPLYKEMNDYLYNLIAQGWVKKINSPYGCLCKEERWQSRFLHRLQKTKQKDPLW